MTLPIPPGAIELSPSERERVSVWMARISSAKRDQQLAMESLSNMLCTVVERTGNDSGLNWKLSADQACLVKEK